MQVRVTAARAAASLLAAYFAIDQFYTSFAALSSTPPVGAVLVPAALSLVVIALVFAGALVLAPAVWRGGNRDERATRPVLLAWIGTVALTTLTGFDTGLGLGVLAFLIVAAIYHTALLRWYGSPGVAVTVIATYLWVGGLAAAAALAMQILRQPVALYALNNGRAAGTFVTANQFAAFLVTFVPCALGVALASRRPALRCLAAGATAVGTLAMLATYSRSGWFALALAIGFMVVAWVGRPYVIPFAAVAAVAAVAFLVAFPDTHHNRAESFNRLELWRTGVRIAERFPLVGTGPMAYWRVYPDLRQPAAPGRGSFAALHPHNAFLSFLTDTGLVGLAALGWGWWRYARVLVGALVRARGPARRFGLAVTAGLVGTFVQGMVDTVGVVEMTYVWVPFMALALAAARHGLGEEA